MKIYYILSEGCNSRHLVDVTVFDRYRDARRATIGSKEAYRLTRHEEVCDYPTPDDILVTTLKERVL